MIYIVSGALSFALLHDETCSWIFQKHKVKEWCVAKSELPILRLTDFTPWIAEKGAFNRVNFPLTESQRVRKNSDTLISTDECGWKAGENAVKGPVMAAILASQLLQLRV